MASLGGVDTSLNKYMWIAHDHKVKLAILSTEVAIATVESVLAGSGGSIHHAISMSLIYFYPQSYPLSLTLLLI
jgi:hypothetical protein